MAAENFKITDKDAIRKAMCSSSIPDDFLPDELEPVGMSKFKGDNLPDSWSVNPHFTKGETYPVYCDSEWGNFVIGNNGVGYDMTPAAWTNIKYF